MHVKLLGYPVKENWKAPLHTLPLPASWKSDVVAGDLQPHETMRWQLPADVVEGQVWRVLGPQQIVQTQHQLWCVYL